MIRVDANQLDLGDYLHSIDAEPQDFGIVVMKGLSDQNYPLTVIWHFATRSEAESFIDKKLFPLYSKKQCVVVSREDWQEDRIRLREHFKKTNTKLQIVEYDRATRRYYKQILP